MNIFYSDEYSYLTADISDLMSQAADVAMKQEFGEELQNCDITSLPIQLSVSIVNRDEIQAINSEFRGIDKVTDVLSFPQFQDGEELVDELNESSLAMADEDSMEILLGDVVICYDKAIEQAEEYGTGTKRELIYLFVHSIFHLFGYDHMEEDEKAVMRTKEEAVMEVLGL